MNKKIYLGFLVTILLISVFLVSLTACSKSNDEDKNKIYLLVQTDSMSGTFENGEVIIVTKISSEEAKNLKVGQIITYRVYLTSNSSFIMTHRIIEVITTDSGAVQYRTQGDHESQPDSRMVGSGNVIAIWGTPGQKGNAASYGPIIHNPSDELIKQIENQEI